MCTTLECDLHYLSNSPWCANPWSIWSRGWSLLFARLQWRSCL